MKYVGKTDIGLVRKINEDSFICLELEKENILGVVADGMGGHFAGEIASQMAVDEITGYIKENLSQSVLMDNAVIALIKEAVTRANKKIYNESQLNSECQGMGTTLSMALVIGAKLFIGHVGDSRIYKINEAGMVKLTEDHSLVAELVKNGTIRPEEADHHPQKNIITRALGTEADIEADALSIELLDKDIIVICSDGLSNMVTEAEIRNIIWRALSTEDGICNNVTECIENACQQLITRAKENGCFDNITVVIMQIIGGGDCSDR